MRRVFGVIAVLVAVVSLSGCQPQWASQMTHLEQFVNGSTMPEFLAIRANPAGTPYASLYDWSTDGCSSGPLGSTVYNFEQACWRHDFSYRNLKRISNDIGGDVWNGYNKFVADRRFEYDMKERCLAFNSIIRPTCNVAAETFYQAVRLVEPYASSEVSDLNPHNFTW